MAGRPHDPNRQRARQAGDRHYIGRKCRNGHDGKRYTSTAACVHCVAGKPAETATTDEFEGLLCD